MTAVRMALAIVVLRGLAGSAQDVATVWDTHEEVAQWVAILGETETSPDLTESLTEVGPTFVRIRGPAAGSQVFPAIQGPTAMGESIGFADLGALPTLARPQEHNAIRLTLRNTTGMDLVSGMYDHIRKRDTVSRPPPHPQPAVVNIA